MTEVLVAMILMLMLTVAFLFNRFAEADRLPDEVLATMLATILLNLISSFLYVDLTKIFY